MVTQISPTYSGDLPRKTFLADGMTSGADTNQFLTDNAPSCGAGSLAYIAGSGVDKWFIKLSTGKWIEYLGVLVF